MSDTPSERDALQAALAGEQAAVYGIGQAAGALSGTELSQARRDLDAHRARRDRLRALIVDGGATPPAGSTAYDVPATPNAAAGRRVLGDIEQRLVAVYADLVSASTGATRALALTSMTESAVRSARWGTAVPAFPGLTERAPSPPSPSASTSPTP